MKKQKNSHEEKDEDVQILGETTDIPSVKNGDATVEDEKPMTSQKEIERLNAELTVKNDAFLRLTAEFQNYRKRVEKEKQELIKYGNEKILLDLLKVMDNFDRALSSFDYRCEENKNVVSGIEMIRKSLDELLKQYGVEAVQSIGELFNPMLHHAVMTEVAEGVEGEVVLEEFQKGYRLNDKVIRHAMVKVSTHD